MLATVILYFCCIVHFSNTCIFIFGYILVYLILVTGPPVDSGPAAHGGGGGGVFFIMVYAGRLHQKGVRFSGFRYMKGEGSHLLKYMKGVGNLSCRSVRGATGLRVHDCQKVEKTFCMVLGFIRIYRRCFFSS